MTRTKKGDDSLTSLVPSTDTTIGSEENVTTSASSTIATTTTHPQPTTTPPEVQTELYLPTYTLKFTPIDQMNFQDDDDETLLHPHQDPAHQFPETLVNPVQTWGPHMKPDGGRSAIDQNEVRNEDYTYKVPSPPVVSVGTVTVRAEEIALVMVVLMLWAGAITLFINRWGKLRMLEPYQPAYTAPSPPPRPPAPQVGPCINIQSTSDLTLAEGGAVGGRYDWSGSEYYGRGSLASGYLGLSRSPSALSVKTLDPQRKVKSAVDLVSLVMQEKMASNLHLAATNV